MNGIQKFEMWLSHMDNQLEEANKSGTPLIVKDLRKEKYPMGYGTKLQYWRTKLDQAIESGNVGGVKHATSKLNYFMNRQHEVYGG